MSLAQNQILDLIKTFGPTGSLIVAILLFLYTRKKDAKAGLKNEFDKFLGGKEPVASAALKIIKEHKLMDTPSDEKPVKSKLIIGSWISRLSNSKKLKEEELIAQKADLVVQSCMFEGSDRARMLLYYIVLNSHKEPRLKEALRIAIEKLCKIDADIKNNLSKTGVNNVPKILDLENWEARLAILKSVFYKI